MRQDIQTKTLGEYLGVGELQLTCNGEVAVAAGTGKPSNPKDRIATARLDLTLFPDTAIAYGALAMTEGHLKYGGYNYRPAGVQSSVYVAACKRHLAKWYNGEECDPVTNVPHLANAIACLAVLIDSQESRNLNDDRPPKVDVASLLTKFEGNVKHLQKIFPNGPGRFRQDNEERRIKGNTDPIAKRCENRNEVFEPGGYYPSNADSQGGQPVQENLAGDKLRTPKLLGTPVHQVVSEGEGKVSGPWNFAKAIPKY